MDKNVYKGHLNVFFCEEWLHFYHLKLMLHIINIQFSEVLCLNNFVKCNPVFITIVIIIIKPLVHRINVLLKYICCLSFQT
ncbi:Structure-specific endonuclease subunit slx1 [Labeo rohita]|uniref:Structure-specific endonuclease subunit slx1 n=1 Tax=Labeo rohita TaxID=84645 RepID=A0ABQ8LML9_LABRO|nr:Structure-specific endonuclease subunit slx1 [Labeo rohita]